MKTTTDQIAKITAAVNALASRIREMAAAHGGTIYARYGRRCYDERPAAYSVNHANGSAEAGLSAVNVYADLADDKIIAYMTSYSYLASADSRRRLTLYSGDVIGSGSDGEPLITNHRAIATISPAAADLISVINRYNDIVSTMANEAALRVPAWDRTYKNSDLEIYEAALDRVIGDRTTAQICSIIRRGLTIIK